MVEQKQTRYLCRFARFGRWAFLTKLGFGLETPPGTVVQAPGLFTRMRWRVYRFRALPRTSLPVLFSFPKPYELNLTHK